MDYEFWLRLRFIRKVNPFILDHPTAIYRLHLKSKTMSNKTAFALEAKPIREQYKRQLNRIQQIWLWGAQRHRKARIRSAKAVALLKTGERRTATRLLMSALAVWPLLIIDFSGIILALKNLINRRQVQSAMPEVWPDWGE